MSAEEARKTAMSDLQKLLSANNILGEPVEVDDKVVIPVVAFGFGYGSGGGKGHGPKGEVGGEGSGGGGGGGVMPIALIVSYKGVKGPEGMRVLPLKKPSPISEAISESMPQIIEAIKTKAEERKKK